jgi:predicted nucleotidyltransferase
MSDLLLGPPTRRAILARTYVDPHREYHLRELVRLTGRAPRTVQQEVDKLVAADLLVDRRDGNRRYLRANDRHPLFNPVREIVVKTEGVAYVVANALGTDGVECAVVFGSIAAAAPRAGSDVDLLIVGTIGLREAVRRLAPVRDILDRVINPVVWTRAEFDRRRQRDDAFLTRVLEGPLIPVVGEVPDAVR